MLKNVGLALIVLFFIVSFVVGMLSPKTVIPWKAVPNRGRAFVSKVCFGGLLVSVIFASNEFFGLLATALFIFLVNREREKDMKANEANVIFQKTYSSSNKKNIKIQCAASEMQKLIEHKTVIVVDEAAMKTCLLRKNSERAIGNFVASEAYFLPHSPLIFVIDKYQHKMCIIFGSDQLSVSAVLGGFVPNEKCFSEGFAYAIDAKMKKLCYFNESGTIQKIYTYKDIIKAEIVEDGDTITETERGSQIGGAIVGGVLFGGTGAIIGGLSGNKKTSRLVSNVVLKILVRDIEHPDISISFLSEQTPRGSSIHQSARANAEKWYGMLQVLIDIASKEEMKDVSQQQVNKPISTIDELQKLAKLHEDGVVSDEEFTSMKNRIIKEM